MYLINLYIILKSNFDLELMGYQYIFKKYRYILNTLQVFLCINQFNVIIIYLILIRKYQTFLSNLQLVHFIYYYGIYFVL
jgi:hypothetical protein